MDKKMEATIQGLGPFRDIRAGPCLLVRKGQGCGGGQV